jgi:integrase
MQAFISSRLITTLKADAKPYEVRDSKLKGFLLRVQPSGAKSYIVEYGRGKRITLGSVEVLTPAQARDRAVEILADVVKGTDPQAVKRAAKVSDFKSYVQQEYGPWVVAHRKDGSATLARLKACFFEELGSKKLVEINPWIMDKWRSTRIKDGLSKATVNRDLTALKACLAKAVEWGFLEAHPLAKLKPSKLDQGAKPRFLAEGEETRLRAALDARENRIRQERHNANEWRRERDYELLPDLDGTFADHLKPMVLLSINTGLRQGELFGLTWENVDLDRAYLTVEGGNAKSGKTRHIPLNGEATAVLVAWQAKSSEPRGLVFPSQDGKPFDNVQKAWTAVLDAAGIKAFRWHDLRHHFASRLVMAGVDLNTVRELLGHADIKMTLRYAHLAPEHKAAAVAKLIEPALAPVISLPLKGRA